MKRKIISALLAGTLCVLSVMPAGAVGDTPSAAQEEQAADPTAVTVKKMGLRAVRAAVEEGSPTVEILRKTAASMDAGGSSGEMDSSVTSPITILQEQIIKLETAITKLEENGDQTNLLQTYKAQKALLEAQLQSIQTSLSSSVLQGQALLTQMEDAAYRLRKQADSLEGQLAQAAQSMLIGIQNLQYSKEQLERQLASLDRTIAVAEVQLSIGKLSQMQMDAYRNQRDNLARSLDTLDVQCENLGSSIALLCGYDAGTVVMPSTIAQVYAADLRAMSYEDDLAEAKSNSFSIWQRRDELRQAQNTYDKDIPATEHAVQSARDALTAEQQAVEASFETIFQSVKDSQTALAAAQTAEQQAELDFHTSEVQYSRGMISRIDYLNAQDTLENARLAVEIAQLNLVSAYNQYDWAKQGVLTTTSATS